MGCRGDALRGSVERRGGRRRGVPRVVEVEAVVVMSEQVRSARRRE